MESSTRASSRKTRVYVFREFILETYGHDYIGKGDIVLDVAGGKGDLSWLLKNVDDIDSIVVDPRTTKNHIERSVKFLRDNPQEAKLRAIPYRPTYQPLAQLISKLEGRGAFETAHHLKILVDSDLVENIQKFKQSNQERYHDDWNNYWKNALQKGKQAQPLGYVEEESATDIQIIDSMEALQTILSVKLIIGFHPDQATEPSIDLAKVLDVPYCIVPCCVFPSEFPNRMLPDGTPVRKYNQFIEYLKQKNGQTMSSAMLGFSFTETAKNIVLYSLPDKNKINNTCKTTKAKTKTNLSN